LELTRETYKHILQNYFYMNMKNLLYVKIYIGKGIDFQKI